MFSFLQPYWLLASAAVALPIIIHLWNVKQGKILQVGSIMFLQQSDRQQAKSLRLKDLLLLLVRCLLIIAIAMLLAKPQYSKPLTTQTEKGWLLIERTDVARAYGEYKIVIDSLIKTGYQFHYFEEDFVGEDFNKAVISTGSNSNFAATNYWALLSILNTHVPANLPIYLFTSNQQKHFTGNRPAVELNLHWLVFKNQETTSKYLVSAYKNAQDKYAVSFALSKPYGTRIENTLLESDILPDSINYNSTNNQLSFAANKLRSSVTVDTTFFKVVIYSGKQGNDALYVSAALNAIRTYGNYKLNLRVIRYLNELPNNVDWLFWLTDEVIPVGIRPKNIFKYARGKEVNIASWVNTGNDINNWDGINLIRRIQPDKQLQQQVIWSDGFGQPVLMAENGKNSTYTFYSRFNPAWNDLVWSRQFPEILLNLILPFYAGQVDDNDQRIVETEQYLPDQLALSATGKQKFIQVSSFDKWFWLLAYLLFCLERFLSLKMKREVPNG